MKNTSGFWFGCWGAMVCMFVLSQIFNVKNSRDLKIERANIISLKEEAVGYGFARYEVKGGTNVIFVWNVETNTCTE